MVGSFTTNITITGLIRPKIMKNAEFVARPTTRQINAIAKMPNANTVVKTTLKTCAMRPKIPGVAQ